MTKYYVPLNPDMDQEGNEQSQTVDIVTLTGTKKQKRAAWRRYLSVRCGVFDYHECNRIARELGFRELVK